MFAPIVGLVVLCAFLVSDSLSLEDGFPQRWSSPLPESSATVSHKAWDGFLKSYVSVRGGVNSVDYANVAKSDLRKLDAYLKTLSRTKVSSLNRAEQFAFWVNAYNALTVRTILRRYPVASIFDIDLSPGADGPWRKKMFEAEGVKLSLDDIEHRILRPIWKDPRIHYAVNCASFGCPNLATVAYTADNAETLLEKGARDYVNHPRGAEVRDGKLFVSGIYFWFSEDFGGKDGVLEHVKKYASTALASRLRKVSTVAESGYDWSLNGLK